MPEEKQDIVSKVEAMKKAGFAPLMIVFITVLSTPGIWERFFDDTDDKALAAIENAYPLLAKEVEQHSKAVEKQQEINQKLLVEITKLKTVVEMSHEMKFVSDIGPVIGAGGGGSGGEFGIGSLSPLDSCERQVEKAVDPTNDEVQDENEKGSLGDLIQQQKQVPVRDNLPNLRDLLGDK